MSDPRELSLERLSVAAKGRDDLEPYVADALRAGVTREQVVAVLRRVLGPAAPVHLVDMAQQLEGEIR